MRVCFVGSGDAFGSGGRFQTCISVVAAGQRILVDCGATSLVALRSQSIDPATIDAVVISHLHGDHFGGLPLLILDGQFRRRTTPLRVVGPPGTGERLLRTMEALFPGSSRIERRFAVRVDELTPDGPHVALDGLSVRGWRVVHESGAPPLAIRVDDGSHSFAYSGDTEWTPALAEAADGASLLAVEAYTFDRPIRYHLYYATLHANLDQLAAGRLVLTHMSAAMLDRLSEVDLPSAFDGMTIDL
jgi:ribonuclease BN (tRNA processing enzyme)